MAQLGMRNGPAALAPELRLLQALRGAACLMVVLYHTLQMGMGDGAITAWPNLSAGVDIFFVLSGVVVAGAARRLAGGAGAARRFLARRALRILPLYWVLTSAKLAITLAAPAATPHTRPDAWMALASYLLIPARDLAGAVRPVLPVGWSLEFEAFFYLLVAAALALRVRLWAVIPVLAALGIAGFYRAAWWPAPLVLANGLGLEFAAGLALGAGAAGPRGLPLRPTMAAGLAVISACLLLTLPLAGPWRFLVWGGPATLLVACLLSLEAPLGARVPRALLSLGDASYAIYLVHPLIIPALARLGLPGLLLAPAASLWAGWVLHARLDTPLRAMLGERLARGGGSPASVQAPA